MVSKTILDAMIKRADFGVQTEGAAVELAEKLSIEQISGKSPYSKLLRKPDFQRETNHWSPSQVEALVKSFANGDLIPALILWKSDSYIFVIDGAHRLSALKAWVMNDYGDGAESHEFFDRNISKEQTKKAAETRRLIEKSVGRYSDFKAITEGEISAGEEKVKLASIIFTRSLQIQWIQGSSKVAEESFFKINSQGTVLDDVEELLLRNRLKSFAVAARSTVRAGTGHKYWSAFDNQTKDSIEEIAKQLHKLLFEPEVDEPIKTLELPLGGASSPLDTLKTLVDVFSIIGGHDDAKKAFGGLKDDTDGSETLKVLKHALKIAKWITGNDSGSLGLHPAVYFYNEQGRHTRFLFLGVIRAIARHVNDNNKEWFRNFTKSRKALEDCLVERKVMINQALANVGSKERIVRVSELIDGLVKASCDGRLLDDSLILKLLKLDGKVGTLSSLSYISEFTPASKSAIFLKAALQSAVACKICHGRISPMHSVSYDHIVPVSKGGTGAAENGQLTHPYCNQAIKGNSDYPP